MRRNRPSRRRSAKKRDELSSPHRLRPQGKGRNLAGENTLYSATKLTVISGLCHSRPGRASGRSSHVRFSNRPVGVKRFQTIRRCSVDVAHGLALLFGIGTKALPLWDSRTRWSNLCSGLAVRRNVRSKRTCELTSSIVPRGTSFHRSVELEFPSIGFDPVEFSCCCRGLLPGPAELGAVHPDAVHDHGQPTR